MAPALALLVVLAASAALFVTPVCLAVTSPYVRPAPRETLSLLQDADRDDAGGQTPQQVRVIALCTRLPCLHLVFLKDLLLVCCGGGFSAEPNLTRF